MEEAVKNMKKCVIHRQENITKLNLRLQNLTLLCLYPETLLVNMSSFEKQNKQVNNKNVWFIYRLENVWNNMDQLFSKCSEVLDQYVWVYEPSPLRKKYVYIHKTKFCTHFAIFFVNFNLDWVNNH